MTSPLRPCQNGRQRVVPAISAVPLALSTACTAREQALAGLEELAPAASSPVAFTIDSHFASIVKSERIKNCRDERPRR